MAEIIQLTVDDIKRRDDGLHEITVKNMEPFVGALCMAANLYQFKQADVVEVWFERTGPNQNWKSDKGFEGRLGQYTDAVRGMYKEILGVITSFCEQGVALEDIASRSGMSNSDLAGFIAGNCMPSLRTMSDIAFGLDCRISLTLNAN